MWKVAKMQDGNVTSGAGPRAVGAELIIINSTSLAPLPQLSALPHSSQVGFNKTKQNKSKEQTKTNQTKTNYQIKPKQKTKTKQNTKPK